MGNLASYKRIWGKHRDEVKRIYKEWRDQMEKLDGYKGSKTGDERIKAANDQYTAAISAENNRYWKEMWPVLKSMQDKVQEAGTAITPPSDGQLRILQAVSYMADGTLDYGTYAAYMELCKDSSVARDTLYSMGTKKVAGGENLSKPVGPDTAADRNYKAMFESARAFGRWDGTSREAAMSAFLEEGHNGIPVGARHTDTAAASAGSIDPTSSDFIHDVVGIFYDADTIHYLD